jgi:hypothetical protein
MKKRIEIQTLRVKHILDEDPDTSCIGAYTDDLKDGVIVRQFDEFYEKLTDEQKEEIAGRAASREMRGFVPYASGETPGTADYYKYGMRDYEEMESLNRGDWQYIGVRAEAEVKYRENKSSWRYETLTSGGIWGIESNSGEHVKEQEQEQLADLKNHLEAFGVDVSKFDTMAKRLEAEFCYR